MAKKRIHPKRKYKTKKGEQYNVQKIGDVIKKIFGQKAIQYVQRSKRTYGRRGQRSNMQSSTPFFQTLDQRTQDLIQLRAGLSSQQKEQEENAKLNAILNEKYEEKIRRAETKLEYLEQNLGKEGLDQENKKAVEQAIKKQKDKLHEYKHNYFLTKKLAITSAQKAKLMENLSLHADKELQPGQEKDNKNLQQALEIQAQPSGTETDNDIFKRLKQLDLGEPRMTSYKEEKPNKMLKQYTSNKAVKEFLEDSSENQYEFQKAPLSKVEKLKQENEELEQQEKLKKHELKNAKLREKIEKAEKDMKLIQDEKEKEENKQVDNLQRRKIFKQLKNIVDPMKQKGRKLDLVIDSDEVKPNNLDKSFFVGYSEEDVKKVQQEQGDLLKKLYANYKDGQVLYEDQDYRPQPRSIEQGTQENLPPILKEDNRKIVAANQFEYIPPAKKQPDMKFVQQQPIQHIPEEKISISTQTKIKKKSKPKEIKLDPELEAHKKNYMQEAEKYFIRTNPAGIAKLFGLVPQYQALERKWVINLKKGQLQQKQTQEALNEVKKQATIFENKTIENIKKEVKPQHIKPLVQHIYDTIKPNQFYLTEEESTKKYELNHQNLHTKLEELVKQHENQEEEQGFGEEQCGDNALELQQLLSLINVGIIHDKPIDLIVITKDKEHIPISKKEAQIIIFLKDHHFTCGFHQDDQIDYFDPLCIHERQKRDVKQLQQFAYQQNPEYMMKLKYNSNKWQENGQADIPDSDLCGQFCYLFLSHIINDGMKYKDATCYDKEKDNQQLHKLVPYQCEDEFPFI